MIVPRDKVLKSLLESKDRIHLTAYIVNSGGIDGMKGQIDDALAVASECLEPVMSADEMERFLEPVRSLRDDDELLSRLKENLGIFRTAKSFRILTLPVSVEHQCIVATTFHVKPLLRWMQVDREFLLLGIEADSASLYHGSQKTLRRLGSVVFCEQPTHWDERDLETVEWLHEKLHSMTRSRVSKPRLFIAGERPLADAVAFKLKYPNIFPKTISSEFGTGDALTLAQGIRSILRMEAKAVLEHSLIEFYHAESLDLGKKNIFQIARAAVTGKVRKLIIADGINIFGKINAKTGAIAIHPADLDHEDDDLLDDLAQTVLSKGGEVVVAQRDEIPKGHPVLAILEHSENWQRSRPLLFKSNEPVRQSI